MFICNGFLFLFNGIAVTAQTLSSTDEKAIYGYYNPVKIATSGDLEMWAEDTVSITLPFEANINRVIILN